MTDPGYDAQFQRGYSGPPIPGPDPEDAPVAHVAPDAAIPAIAPIAATERVGEIGEDSENGQLHDADPEEPAAPRRNPWLIALLVVSILMALVGGWLLRAYASAAIGGYTTNEQQTTALAQSEMAPVLLVGGITGVIAWLLLGALGAIAVREHP